MPDESNHANSKSEIHTRTFLLTDVEGSTRLTERYPEAMRTAMARHDACITAAVSAQGGRVLKERGGGDSVFAVFNEAGAAVRAAYGIQQALAKEDWSDELELRVRIGVHTGEAEWRDGDYRSAEVTRCARLRDIGHGGQTLLSKRVAREAESDLPDGVSLRDMGLHRLKDLRQAEYVFQLAAPDLPTDFPPLRSLSHSPNNLPERLDSFIGREAEVEAVRRMLSQTASVVGVRSGQLSGSSLLRQAARLVTILGPGGCGKTRLALQVGAELLEEYPDGVWFVDLTGIADGPLVSQAVGAVLGVREPAGGTVGEALAVYCKPKTLLLVLDNCEHVVAECARFAEALLQSCPDLCVLATSREPLELHGERHHTLPPLALPDVKHLPDWEMVAAFPAVQLFVERAQARKPEFVVGPDNAELVAKICARLDGVPLLLELVAPKVALLTLKQIDARLYGLIRGDSPSLPERQRNLQALIQWSVDLLKPEERVLLPRLSVFAGGWTLEAAEVVGAGPGLDAGDVLESLLRLVNASLVLAERQDEAYRYRLLETVREYTREELAAADEEHATQDRHVAYFLELAEECEPKLQGAEQAETIRRLETEHDNFRAALRWAGRSDTRLRLANALYPFWADRYITEGRGWLENALQAGRDTAPAIRAKGLNALAGLAIRQSDYEAARNALTESLRLWEVLGDKHGTAEALTRLGRVHMDTGEFDRARDYFERSLQMSESVNDRRGVAMALNNLGIIARELGNYDKAHSCFEQSLAIRTELDDQAGIASLITNLGALCVTQENYPEAGKFFKRSLEMFNSLGNTWAATVTLYNLGEVARKQKKNCAAQGYYLEAAQASLTLGDKRRFVFAMRGFLFTLIAEDSYKQAAMLMSAVAALSGELDIAYTRGEAEDWSQHTRVVCSSLSHEQWEYHKSQGTRMNITQVLDFVTELYCSTSGTSLVKMLA